MNIQLDLSELFLSAQSEALESATVSGDEFGSYIDGADEFFLKDMIHDEIVRQAVNKVNTTVIERAMKENNFHPEKLRSKFESMAAQNMTQAIDDKVSAWFDSDIVTNEKYSKAFGSDEPETISVNDLIERVFAKSISNINDRYSEKSLERTIHKIVDNKVSDVIGKYEHQIQERVDATASALIQKQVQETLTSTFTMLMKAGDNQNLIS